MKAEIIRRGADKALLSGFVDGHSHFFALKIDVAAIEDVRVLH
jgi:hypothetical protein